ncbi:hypothetical protein [Gemella haemolysans]|uniref:hypothetical protein n=1 Tax=Gemella haemolysans TaxID=1379 RepID=UPI0026F210F6|nr:hypothetical protein [Gemella haemolysans]
MDKQEMIKHIEEIEQRLTSLQLSMELLATHTDVIDVLTPEELKNSSISSEELIKYWDKVNDGNKLHTLTNAIAINTSEELSILCYEKLDKVKQALKEVM